MTATSDPALVAGVTAADVLAAGECTAPCLLSREPGGCGCRCGGRWHGTLSGVVVSGSAITEAKSA